MKRKRLSKTKLREDAISNGSDGEGRDPVTGRFLPGWKGGPGNPFAARVHVLRASIFAAVSPEDIRKIIKKLIRLARNGDIAAARIIMDRTTGRVPAEFDQSLSGFEKPDPDERFD